MDVFGVDVNELAVKITAIGGIISTIVTAIWGIIERRQKKRAQKISNNGEKINNADKVHETLSKILKSIDEAEEYRLKHFKNYLDYCENNYLDFTNFIKKRNEN